MAQRNQRKTIIGKVVSDKMQKTIVVSVTRHTKHPIYKKVVVSTKKYKAHDEDNTCRIGDTVKLMETRPLSREKRWRLVSVIKKVE